jgi:hypothetical protein
MQALTLLENGVPLGFLLLGKLLTILISFSCSGVSGTT